MPPHLPLTVSTPRLGIHTSVSAIALARRYYVAISGAIVHSSRHSSTQAQNSRIGIANRNGYGYGHGHSNGIGTGNRIAAESVCGSIFRTASAVRASSSSSSSTRWKSRQGKDAFAREAKVKGLKSRAAFKLLEVSCVCFLLFFGEGGRRGSGEGVRDEVRGEIAGVFGDGEYGSARG